MNSSAKGRKVVRYIRVSRADQDPSLQLDETAALIAGRGWQLTDTFVDHGVSGAKEKRPELDRLLAAAKRGKFDAVLVWRSDRLARSLKHLVTVIEDLAAMGIDFVSVTEPLDTTTPSGKLLLSIVGAMAEFERAILVERVRAGIDAARRRGTKIGRPRVRVDLVRARALRAEGCPYRIIASRLGVGEGTLRRALRGSSQSRGE